MLFSCSRCYYVHLHSQDKIMNHNDWFFLKWSCLPYLWKVEVLYFKSWWAELNRDSHIIAWANTVWLHRTCVAISVIIPIFWGKPSLVVLLCELKYYTKCLSISNRETFLTFDPLTTGWMKRSSWTLFDGWPRPTHWHSQFCCRRMFRICKDSSYIECIWTFFPSLFQGIPARIPWSVKIITDSKEFTLETKGKKRIEIMVQPADEII